MRIFPVRLLPVRLVPILLIACLSAQQPPPTATIGPAIVEIAPPRPNYPFPDGRGYVYLAEWHLITAGTAVVKMEGAGNDRKVTASAESSGAVDTSFPCTTASNRASIRGRSARSRSSSTAKKALINARLPSISITRTRKVRWMKNLKTGQAKHVENDLAACATDVITGFYYLQSLPLQPGASYEFPISDGKTTIVRATNARWRCSTAIM